jgi:outer membrane protein with beta-barrel domain
MGSARQSRASPDAIAVPMYSLRAHVRPPRLLCGLAALLGVALGGRAHAAGEGEWQLAGRTGAGTIGADGRTSWGFVGAADLDYGLTDSWALRATLFSSLHSMDAESPTDMRPTGRLLALGGLGGLTYTIDILRLVPYADLQLGFVHVGGAIASPGFAFITALGIGADYYVTRQWTAGAHFQYLFDPIDLFADPLNLGRSPYGFSATLRLSRIF